MEAKVENNAHEFFMSPISIVGIGCLEKAVNYIKPQKLRKALIVSDKPLVESGLIEKLLKLLDNEGILYIIYKDVSPNPTVAQVKYGLKLFLDNGCDFLISFGGGSPHDCAKAIALLATNGGDIRKYEGINKATTASAPLIAINTTAGTGSELTRFCVITDEDRHVKMAINDWHVTPTVAVSDAELMVGMPPSLTAATGMDALTHAIEAYVSTDATPFSDCTAVKAVELILANLEKAYNNGTDLRAREAMAFAEYLAGIAFNNAGLGYVHAMAHQLGGYYNLPHGLCNAILLPVVMEFNQPAVPERYTRLAQAAGMDNSQQLLEKVKQLNKTLGLPSNLSSLKGFNSDDIPQLAENALLDVTSLTNPRPATKTDIEGLFRSII